MTVTVSTPAPLGQITVRGGDALAPVQVSVLPPPAPPTVVAPAPVPPAVVQVPGTDLGLATVPEYAEYPEQTVQQRLEQLIDLKAERVFQATERFTVDRPDYTVTLAQRVLPGSLEVYLWGLRQFELDDVPTDGQTYAFPAEWGLEPGDPLIFVYDF
ncbi:hypothetical protein [Deinococcus rufus]|uniref:Uncharacterized protein n=1 Tax=Deinococcus rufus TaxID=2136097 RepID=A0ABV7ZA07_9DEIO